MNKMLSLYKVFYSLIANKFRHFYSSTIISIVEVDYDGYVYNLSIDGDETYIADGIVVHNCRSTTIPKIKDEYDIGSDLKGKRPAVGADGAEQVSSRTTYGGWLKNQPPEFVDEALGVERSRLFRSGKVSLDKFVDPTGRVYTLTELSRMDSIAMIE